MTQIQLIKNGAYLMPSLPEDEAKLLRIKHGEVIEVSFKKPRNAPFHRKFMALMQIVVDNTDYDNIEQVLHIMKLKLWHFETVINTNGKVIYIPKSISFAKMDEIEFSLFYQLAINKVLSDFLTNWQEEDINKAIEQVIRF